MSDKEYKSQISSLRAPVERLVAHFKNWKIFHADYRRPCRTYRDAFDAARGLFFFSITWGFDSRSGYGGSLAWMKTAHSTRPEAPAKIRLYCRTTKEPDQLPSILLEAQ